MELFTRPCINPLSVNNFCSFEIFSELISISKSLETLCPGSYKFVDKNAPFNKESIIHLTSALTVVCTKHFYLDNYHLIEKKSFSIQDLNLYDQVF